MPRIVPVKPDQTDATPKSVQAKLGVLPYLLTTLTQAHAAIGEGAGLSDDDIERARRRCARREE